MECRGRRYTGISARRPENATQEHGCECFAVRGMCGNYQHSYSTFSKRFGGSQQGRLRDYETALRKWRSLAKERDARAQRHLGVMYAKGLGVPQDDAKAVKWYRKAAVQGVCPGTEQSWAHVTNKAKGCHRISCRPTNGSTLQHRRCMWVLIVRRAALPCSSAPVSRASVLWARVDSRAVSGPPG